MIFHDATITPQGSVRSMRRHESTRLVPEVINLFGRMLDGNGSTFRRRIPGAQWNRIRLQWTRGSSSAAIATFLSGDLPLTNSGLIGGVDTESETGVLASLQGLINELGRGLGFEPRSGLLDVRERPLIASIPLPVPSWYFHDMSLVADMATCLAAAFFERARPPKS